MKKKALLLTLLLLGCQPVNPSIRNGYTVYRGRTSVVMTEDPKIPKVEPNYPSDRK